MEHQTAEHCRGIDQEAWLAKRYLDQASLCFLRCDTDGRITYGNRKACTSLGYTPAELLTMTVFDIHPTVSAQNWPVLWKRICDDGSVSFDALHRRKDGSIFPVEVTGDLVDIDGSRFAGWLIKESAERHRGSEMGASGAVPVDTAAIGFFRTGADARLLDVNDQACRSLGYSREELCGMSLLDINPRLTADMRDELWRRLCTEGTLTVDTVHRRKDGTLLPVNVTCNLLEVAGAKYAISFTREIGGRQPGERRPPRLEADLSRAQKLETLGTLAGGIAHDFNNILSAIYGYAELALLRCSKNTKLQLYIDQIYTASIRAKTLVQQILAFDRQDTIEKRNIDIGIVVRETLKLMRATLPSSIEIRERIQVGGGDVSADETAIHQLMTNLCQLACQAMREAGGLLEVSLEPVTVGTYDSSSHPVLSPGRYLKLVVADTGQGMDRETLSRLFDDAPFSTAADAETGSGGELAVIHRIVTDHGGSTKVYSRPAVGTTVQVFFPLAEAGRDRSVEASGQPAPGSGSILLVDDEQTLLNIAKEFLEDLGYRVDARLDPVEAGESFRRRPEAYDLVITDLTMPNMRGDRLAGEIRAVRPGMPIILCTGMDPESAFAALEAAGLDLLLRKPINLTDLANTVRKALRQSAAD